MTSWALVTGASSGLGAEFARLLAARGYNLIIVARREDKLLELKKELTNVEVKIMVKNLADTEAPYEIVRELENTPIEILINNAGFGNFGKFIETDLERDVEMIDVNITTLTVLTKLFAQKMAAQKNGKILNVASTAAFLPGPLMAVYYASKAYVLSFSQAIANELNGTGVTVTALCPGPTATGFEKAANLGASNLFKGKLPTAKVVAEAGLTALFTGKTTIVQGAKNKVMVFLLRLVPRSTAAAIARKVQS